jgi:hypothetical protein
MKPKTASSFLVYLLIGIAEAFILFIIHAVFVGFDHRGAANREKTDHHEQRLARQDQQRFPERP